MSELMLISAGESGVKLWEGTKCTLFQEIVSPSLVSQVCCSPNGQFLAVSSPDQPKVPVYFCNKPLSQPIELLPEIPQSYVRFGNTSSRYVVTCNEHHPVVTVWDLKTRKATKKLKTGLSKGVTCVAYNNGDTHVASGGHDGSVGITNVVSSVSLAPMLPSCDEPQAVVSMQFSPLKQNLLGSVSDEGSCVLWDCNARVLLHSFTYVHAAPATGIAFSPIKEVLLATVGLDKRLYYYDLQFKKAVITVDLQSPSTSVDFSADGIYVAVGCHKGSISIYDVRSTQSPISVVSAHNKAVNALCFNKHPNGLKDWYYRSNTSIPEIVHRSMENNATTPEIDNLSDINSNSMSGMPSPTCKLPETPSLGQDLQTLNATPRQNTSVNFASSPQCLTDGTGAVTSTSTVNGPTSEQWQEAMEKIRVSLHEDVVNLQTEMKYGLYKVYTRLNADVINMQMEMIRNFDTQKNEFEEMLGYRALAANLMTEVNTLKKEISDLKKRF